MAQGNTSKTFEMCYWGLFVIGILILGSKKTLNNVKCFFISYHLVGYSELQMTIPSCPYCIACIKTSSSKQCLHLLSEVILYDCTLQNLNYYMQTLTKCN
jgi:hypothetical protein